MTTPTTALDEQAVRYDIDGRSYESVWIAPIDAPPRAGLVFAPDWYGIYEYPRAEARKLARLGYGVLVVDVYGAGVHPTTDDEAGALFASLHGDRASLRARMVAALSALRARLPRDAKVSAFGFSAGGMAVLELARTGADLERVVVLSGILDAASGDAAAIRAPVLVLHGSADAFAPFEQLVGFLREMDGANRPYQLELFGGAAHAFTNPKFAGVTAGPLRYSPHDAARADAAITAYLGSPISFAGVTPSSITLSPSIDACNAL